MSLDTNTQLVFHLLMLVSASYTWLDHLFSHTKCYQSHPCEDAVLTVRSTCNTSSYVPLYPVDVSEKPNSVQVAAQREQLTENSPVASSRPGKRAGALDTKPKAELRQPNEPHTAIVGSATAPPPGRREAPVGRESVKVPAVQAAPHPLAQASDQGYGTGTGSSSRNTLVTGMR